MIIDKRLQTSIDTYSGAASFSLDIVSLPGRNGLDLVIPIAYFGRVEGQASTWNLGAPTGLLGLGWHLPMRRIVMARTGVAAHTSPEYFLLDNGPPNRLLQSGSDGAKQTFTLENWLPWRISYDPGRERWEIVDENGTVSVYGDLQIGGDEAIAPPSRNTVQWSIGWGNWIGASNQTRNQRRFVSAWNLAEVTDRFGDRIAWFYDNINVAVSSSSGLAFTAASYPLRVLATDGQTVSFNYGDKESAEVQDPHTNPPPPNAWQERIERRYLRSIDIQAADGTLLSSERFDYGAPTFLGSGAFSKRLLLGIQRMHTTGGTLPGAKFSYWGQDPNDGVSIQTPFNATTHALYGAMKQAILPEGGWYVWEYQALTPAHSSRSMRVDPPVATGVTFSNPRVLFSDGYTVVTWLGTGTATLMAVRALTWDGRWLVSPDETISLPDTAAYDAAQLACGSTAFAIYAHARLHLYALDLSRGGQWIQPPEPYAPSFDGNDVPLLVSGDTFAALVGSVSGKLYRYRFDGLQWQADPLETLSAGGSGAIFTIAAQRNMLIAGGIRTSLGGAPLYVTLYRRDGTGAWLKSATFQTASALAPVASLSFFAGDAFMVYRGVQTVATQKQVKFGALVWNASLTSLADQAFDTLLLDGSAPVPGPAIAGSLVAVGQMTYRYNGVDWVAFNVATITYPGQQSVDFVGVASDLVVRRIKTGTSEWTGDLVDFNPDTGVWSTPAAVSVPATAVQAVAAPRRGILSDYAVVGGSVRYHSWTGAWNDTQVSLVGIVSTEDANSVQLLPDFLVYQVDSGTDNASTRVFFFANGTTTATTPLPLAGKRFIIPGRPADTLVGIRAFLTYTGTFGAAGSVLELHRAAGTAVDGGQLTYALLRLTAYNGYANGDVPGSFPTGFVFDTTAATIDPSGTLPQFNVSKVLPGDSAGAYGANVTAYFNGLPPSDAPAIPYPVDATAANAQTFYSLAKGLVYQAELRNGEDEASSSLTRYDWITVKTVASTGIAFYARSRKIENGIDGVITTTTSAFDPNTGLVTQTARDNTDIDGRIQCFRRQFTYFWQIYGTEINLLTPIVQEIDSTQTPSVSANFVVTANRVTTWKSDWGSGPGQWAPYKAFAARSADAPVFTQWQPDDPDPAGWLRVGLTATRSSYGEASRVAGIFEQMTSIGRDAEAAHVVWLCINADSALDEVAYFGCEPYELTWGWTWSDPTRSIWDFATITEFHTGTQSILLPASGAGQKVGPVRIFQPGAQQRRFLFSLWARRDNGFDPANGKAYVEIAVRDVTTNEWLTPIVIEIAGAAGTWGYVQRVLDLDVLRGGKPSTDVLALHISAYNQNTTTPCYVDELRFCPLDSSFRATVYNPSRFDVTSAIAHNGQNVTTLYDRYARPVAEIGPLGRIQRVLSASYSRTLTPSDAFLPSYPNSTLQLGTSSFSRYYDFHNANSADWAFSDAAQWQIAGGALQHRGTVTTGLGSTAQLKVIASRNFAARILVQPGSPPPSTIALGNNDVFLRWSETGQWQLVRLAGTTVTILQTSQLSGFRSEWIFVCVDGFILAYVDGVQVFAYTYVYPSPPPPNWGKVTIATSGDCDFDDLIVLQEPQLSLSFADGLGRPLQAWALQGRAIDGVYPDQYPLSATGTFYDALGRAQYNRVDLTAPLAIAPPPGHSDEMAASLVVADQSTYLRTGSGTALSVSQFIDGVGGYNYQQLTFESSPLSRITRSVPPRPTTADAELAAVELRYDGAINATQWLPPNTPPVRGGRFNSVGATFRQTIDGTAVAARYQRICDRMGRTVTLMQGVAAGVPNITGYVYDDAGRLAAIRQPNYYYPPVDSSAASWVEQREYEFLGPLTKITTPDSNETDFAHDDAGRLRFSMDAAGRALSPQQIQFIRYDSLGRAIETGYIQDAGYSWGSSSLSAKLNDQRFPDVDPNHQGNPNYAAGQWRKRFTYDFSNDPAALYAAGALVKVELNSGDSANPDVETYAYDAYGNVIDFTASVRQFDSAKVWAFHYDYDGQDRISLITYPAMDPEETPFKVGYSYDRLGRIAAIGNAVDPGGIVDPSNPPPPPEKYYSDLTYGANGFLACERLNNGFSRPSITRTFSYSNAGALQSISDDFISEAIGWDSGGVMPQSTDFFSGLVASDGFDYHAGPRWSTPPSPYNYTIASDATGELRAAENSLGENWSISLGAPGLAPYDANGNILAIARDITVTQYAYTKDAKRTNRLDHTTSNAVEQLSFRFVPANATSYEGWSWGSNNGGPSSSRIDTTQGHDGPQSLLLGGGSLGHFERLQFSAYLPPDGTLTVSCWVKTAPGFDTAPCDAAWYLSLTGPLGEVVEVLLGAVPPNAGGVWTQMTVTRDIAALRTQFGIERAVDQALVELRNYKQSLTTTGPYVLVDDIALSAVAVGTFVYDNSGRVTQASGRNIGRIVYDPVSSLPKTIETTGSKAATTSIIYNAADKRVLAVVTSGDSTQKTLQLRGIAATPFVTRTSGPEGTMTTYWVIGPSGAIAFKRGEAITYVLCDHLGSARVLVDGESGQATGSLDYLPFGGILRQSGVPAIDRLYTGQQLDATGLYNYNARLYDPQLGRFLQPDPDGQFSTPYSYVGSEPFDRIDPSGRNAIVLIRSTKPEPGGFFETPDTGHAGVLVQEPNNPGLWIFRDIVPGGKHKPLACATPIYNVYWFEVFDRNANGTEPNYPSNSLRYSQWELCFRTKSELVNHLRYNFPRFRNRPDAILEVALTPEQARDAITAYEWAIEKQLPYCTLGLNCAAFVESGLAAAGVPEVEAEASWLFGVPMLPLWPLLGGNPLGSLKTPNALYRAIAASGLNVTYHKDLDETRDYTLTSSSLGSAYLLGLGGLSVAYSGILYAGWRYRVPLAGAAIALGTQAVAAIIQAAPTLLGLAAFFSLPQVVGDASGSTPPGDGEASTYGFSELASVWQPTPGYLIGGDPEKQVIFAEPGTTNRIVVQLSLGTLTAPPVFFNGYAFAGEGNTGAGSLLHAWSLADGRDAWSGVTIDASVDATPVIQAAVMYVAAADGYLYAYDISAMSSARSIWRVNVMNLSAGTKVKTSALILSLSGNEIYLVSAGGIWAVGLRTRTVAWHAAATLSFTQAMPLYDGRLLVASASNSLYAFDTTAAPDGSTLPQLWRYDAPAALREPVNVASLIGVLDGAGTLHVLDTETGRETAHLANAVPTSAVTLSAVFEDLLVAGTSGGEVIASRIVIQSGALVAERLWSLSVGAPISSAPIAFAGVVYIAPMGKLQAYRLRDHALLWETAAPSNISRLGPLSLGLRLPQSTASVKFLLDGADFFLTLRNLLLAAKAGTFAPSTPLKSPTAGQLLEEIGAAGGRSYLMLWDNTTLQSVARSWYLGPILDLVGKKDTRENVEFVRSLNGKPGVQAILVPYWEYGDRLPFAINSQHQKVAIVSVAGTKLAIVGGFNLDTPLYWDDTTHPMLGTDDTGRKNYATWHDTALLLQGAAADLLEKHYDGIWAATGRSPMSAPGQNYAKLAFWSGKGGSCLDKYESCAGTQAPTPYVNPTLSTLPVGVDLLVTNAQRSERIANVRARLVQRIAAATSYVYLENYAINDIEIVRALIGKLRAAAASFVAILMTPHPTKGDDGGEQVGENYLTKMSYAAIFLATQPWTSFATTSGETVQKSAVSNFEVVLDDRGPERCTVTFTSGGSQRNLSLSVIADIAAPASTSPNLIFCSPARYLGPAGVQPGDERYELTGGVLSIYFRKVYVHSKLALIDDNVAIIGSANFTERSLYRDGETSLCINDAATVVDIRTRLFSHWGMTTAAAWYTTMTSFATAPTLTLGVVPLTFKALPNDWPDWQWRWLASIVDASDFL